jgi:hypothetical protein
VLLTEIKKALNISTAKVIEEIIELRKDMGEN